VDAQQARRILDRLVGYQISPILWQIFYYGLSAGRVQTVGLRLVCEREAEIEAFVPEEYWTVEALLETPSGAVLPARLTQVSGRKADLKRKAEVDPLLEELREGQFLVTEVARKDRLRNPQPPYITSTLQRDAARQLRFSPKKIMMLAQQLYEGVDLGDNERVGLITYMRTDSVRVSSQAKDSARQYIAETFGDQFLPDKARAFRQRKEAQDAHEAIRPTDVHRAPDAVRKYLKKDHMALYDLIWRRYVASQMASARYETTEVVIAAGDHQLKANGRVLKFPGFLNVYDEQIPNGEQELPPVNEGDRLTLQSVEGAQHFTEPPPRYTEATLIKELEDKGIGRPSTYASIVSIIQEREYVAKEEGRLRPTTLGRQVWLTLQTFFPDVFDTSFTALMEEELDRVEGGTDTWQKVVQDFYKPFRMALDHIDDKKGLIKSQLQEETDVKCEKCGRQLIKKWGRNGQFLACPAYPDCKFSRPLVEDSETTNVNGHCPKCGGKLIAKVGRYGRFAACEQYPECKHTQAWALGVDCPRPGCDGQVVEKVTRSGKRFYGCSRYPKCDFATWDKPVAAECPGCENPYLVEKTSVKRGVYLKCPKCKEEVSLE
jgi:DNA topoisomerase-1